MVVADIDARVAMAALSFHEGDRQAALDYWVDSCDRLDALVNDSEGAPIKGGGLALIGGKGQGTAGFPGGVPYRCERYAADPAWLREARLWPDAPVAWFQELQGQLRSPRSRRFFDD